MPIDVFSSLIHNKLLLLVILFSTTIMYSFLIEINIYFYASYSFQVSSCRRKRRRMTKKRKRLLRLQRVRRRRKQTTMMTTPWTLTMTRTRTLIHRRNPKSPPRERARVARVPSSRHPFCRYEIFCSLLGTIIVSCVDQLLTLIFCLFISSNTSFVKYGRETLSIFAATTPIPPSLSL